MARPRKDPARVASIQRAVRLTADEDALLEQLLRLQAAEQEARQEPGDASFTTWLKRMIRKEAKAAGIALAESSPAPRARARRG